MNSLWIVVLSGLTLLLENSPMEALQWRIMTN